MQPNSQQEAIIVDLNRYKVNRGVAIPTSLGARVKRNDKTQIVVEQQRNHEDVPTDTEASPKSHFVVSDGIERMMWHPAALPAPFATFF